MAGLTVLVTRPEGQADALATAFAGAGALVTAIPTVRLLPPSDPDPLANATRRIDEYDWVVLTSANAVARLAAAAADAGTLDGLRRQRFAAIGPATAEALGAIGCSEPLTPNVFRGEALAEAILSAAGPDRVAGLRVLIARAETARAVLPERLTKAGARVEIVSAYRTVVNTEARQPLLDLIELGALDWLTFTAASTVRAFVELTGAQTGGASVAAISPVTAAAIAEVGLPIHAVASSHTATGLVEAIVAAVSAVRP